MSRNHIEPSCYDPGQAHLDDEGDPCGPYVEICQHLLSTTGYSYDTGQNAEDDQALITITERPGRLTEHACTDADCPRWVLCSAHWTEL